MYSRSPSRRLFRLMTLLLVVGMSSARASAQCATQWLPGDGVPGTNGCVNATTMWDPDGPGPMQAVVVVGGYFTLAGKALANNIALYDPVSGVWSALGTGMDYQVNALATLPSGDLAAGGDFTTADGVSANRIALWNGTNWSALGTGMHAGSPALGRVGALTTLPNGDVVAGGSFTTAGGVSTAHIARWDGTSWLALGSGMNAPVHALACLPNALVAGGHFTTAGGLTSAYYARFSIPCPATATPFGAGCSSTAGPIVLTATSLPWVGGTFRSTCTRMAPTGLAFGLFGFTSAGVT